MLKIDDKIDDKIDYKYKYDKYKTKYLQMEHIEKISNIAKNINILGMGESIHFLNKIGKFRIDVFKYLVENYSYNVFVLEDQYSCCELVNDYINNRSNTPALHLIANFMFPWESIDMLGLIEWMKEYNLRNDNKNKLEFKGIDIQYIYTDYKNRSDNVAKYVKKLMNKKDKMVSKIYLKSDGYDDISRFRDKSMFDVFMKIYDPNKKYFIFAHNVHLQKEEDEEYSDGSKTKFLGFYLSNHFKNMYYVIGGAFYYGKWSGYNYDKNNYNLEVNPSTKKEIGTIKLKDLDKIYIKENQILKDGLNTNNNITNFDKYKIFQGGTAAKKNKSYKCVYSISINKKYDAVMVINDEEPLNEVDFSVLYNKENNTN